MGILYHQSLLKHKMTVEIHNLLELQLSWPHWMVTHNGSSLRVFFMGTLYLRSYCLGYLFRTTMLFILSLYMGPVARQVDYH